MKEIDTQNKIPFDEEGGLIKDIHIFKSYIRWRPNFTFKATLQFKGSYDDYFIFKDVDTNLEYFMCITDFCSLLKWSTIEKGITTNIWTFAKRGKYFTIIKNMEI